MTGNDQALVVVAAKIGEPMTADELGYCAGFIDCRRSSRVINKLEEGVLFTRLALKRNRSHLFTLTDLGKKRAELHKDRGFLYEYNYRTGQDILLREREWVDRIKSVGEGHFTENYIFSREEWKEYFNFQPNDIALVKRTILPLMVSHGMLHKYSYEDDTKGVWYSMGCPDSLEVQEHYPNQADYFDNTLYFSGLDIEVPSSVKKAMYITKMHKESESGSNEGAKETPVIEESIYAKEDRRVIEELEETACPRDDFKVSVERIHNFYKGSYYSKLLERSLIGGARGKGENNYNMTRSVIGLANTYNEAMQELYLAMDEEKRAIEYRKRAELSCADALSGIERKSKAWLEDDGEW